MNTMSHDQHWTLNVIHVKYGECCPGVGNAIGGQ
jgi:hypothetical protein